MTSRAPAVARVLERVTQTVRSHEMFVPGDSVMVAVSGGPDSMCLLESLYRLRRLFRVHLEVFHFDHRLREGSHDDALYVKRAAAKLKLPFHLEVATTEPEKGASVEDWAHRARTQTLARVLREADATKAAIAHTRDDQAETVLLSVIRGGGLDSATGIRPCQGPYVRPLIDCTRDEVEAFCRALHLRPRMDPTNEDTNLLRNAVRHKVLPQLERAVGREVKATLARTADNLRFDADLLQQLALKAFDDLYEEEQDGFAFQAASLLSLPQALGTRVVRTALYRSGLAPPSSEHIEAVLDLASGRPGRRRDLPGGLLATRDRGYVRVSRTRSGG